jgi:hypothetical protein
VSEFCYITLVAIHPERNVRHSYRLSLGRNLLGDWTVELRYGRIGQRGQERRIVWHSLEEGRRLARTYLRRRISAPRRIGCPYRVANFDPGQTDLLSSALPNGLVPG